MGAPVIRRFTVCGGHGEEMTGLAVVQLFKFFCLHIWLFCVAREGGLEGVDMDVKCCCCGAACASCFFFVTKLLWPLPNADADCPVLPAPSPTEQHPDEPSSKPC